MNFHDMTDAALLEVLQLKGPSLLLAGLLLLGYGAKLCPWVQNKFIPLIVVCGGGALGWLFIPMPPTQDINPGLCCTEATEWASVFVTGLLVGALAWLLHATLLKKWIDEKLKPKTA